MKIRLFGRHHPKKQDNRACQARLHDSGQIQSLEEPLGTPLFAKSGRGLVLTEAGRMVLGYAEDILSTGAELEEAVRDYPRKGKLLEFRVGVADAVPKTITCRLIEPAS